MSKHNPQDDFSKDKKTTVVQPGSPDDMQKNIFDEDAIGHQDDPDAKFAPPLTDDNPRLANDAPVMFGQVAVPAVPQGIEVIV